LFSVAERKGGDLGIYIKAEDCYGVGENLPKILHQRYSIHMSGESSSGINAIKQTIALDNGETISTQNYATAVKRDNDFAFAFSSMAPSLEHDKYISTSASKAVIDLGVYDPNRFSLIYAVFVSSARRKFRVPPRPADFSVEQLAFKEFRLTVIWGFALFPSLNIGWRTHGQTIPPEVIPEDLKEVMAPHAKGHEEIDCVNHFGQSASLLLKSVISRHIEKLGQDAPKFLQFLPALGLFKRGLWGPETTNRIQVRKLSGAIPWDAFSA
jgi:hypothetical protein